MENVSEMVDNGAVDPQQPVGIKELARALGVSIGTVDRALHDRPGINALTRARVLTMAQTLGYRPNVAARYLKLKRKLHISVHLPQEIAFFFDALRQGIREAALPFASTVDLQFRTVRRLGEGEAERFREALEGKINGLIVAPGHPAEVRQWIRKAARQHVPVVCGHRRADNRTAHSSGGRRLHSGSDGGRVPAERGAGDEFGPDCDR